MNNKYENTGRDKRLDGVCDFDGHNIDFNIHGNQAEQWVIIAENKIISS